VWAPQGGDGQKQVLELSTLPDVENLALAPSQGYQRPRRAAGRKRRTSMIKRMDNVGIVIDNLAAATEFFAELVRYQDSYRLCYVRGPEGIIIELAEQIS